MRATKLKVFVNGTKDSFINLEKTVYQVIYMLRQTSYINESKKLF